MKSFIDFALDRSRTIILLLALIVLGGIYAYLTMPKESKPDIKIPILYVSTSFEGISPEDSERLLVRPIEQHLQTIGGIKKISSSAYLGGATTTLEFKAGFDSDKALADVRSKVDSAKEDLPVGTNEPVVKEVNLSLLPVLIIKLSGDLPVRTLYRLARQVKDNVEHHVSEVLKAEIVGDREEVVEVVLDQAQIQKYHLRFEEVMRFISRNNLMVSAGELDMKQGRFSVKVPGIIKTIPDVMGIPVYEKNGRVLTLSDIARVSRTFKDPQNFARDHGKPAVGIEITKRTGENIIETVAKIKAVMAKMKETWPEHINIAYAQDESSRIEDMLNDLQNQILFAVLLVMIIVVVALGWRSSVLVGVAVPGAFLAGVFALYLMGFTLNIVVLFSLILSIGMLVDGAIIVVEYADRKMVEGLDRKKAYQEASKRMFWPVVSSTATILVVFLPLLFWPGIVGEFMKFLPITLLATLSASLLMALIFIPVLGAIFGKIDKSKKDMQASILATEKGDLSKVKGSSGVYIQILEWALDRSSKVVWGAVGLLITIFSLYFMFGKGMEFFPEVEPDSSVLLIRSRGNLSLHEKDEVVKKVESRLLGMPGFSSIYTRVGSSSLGEDVVGTITFELVNWQQRPSFYDVMKEVENKTKDIAGIKLELRYAKPGPRKGKPITIEVASFNENDIKSSVKKIETYLNDMLGVINVENNDSLPGIEWRLKINREQAARYGVSVMEMGHAVKLVTNGLKIASFRPDDSFDEVDIILRYPKTGRHMSQFDDIRIITAKGLVPLTNIMQRLPKPRVSKITTVDGMRVITVKADVERGFLVNDKINLLKHQLKQSPLPSTVQATFRGEDEDKQETQDFLAKAFIVAIFLVVTILVTQFNSFYSTWLVVSSIIMSTIGVLFGLLVTMQPFNLVMGGIGIIALAGIIVSNNIILIDTFDILRKRYKTAREAIIRTGAQRLRPVFLTQFTTILGLVPILFGINVDFFQGEITVGAPSTQWWTQLSATIVYGITFASVLTLVVTPCALMLREENHAKAAQDKNLKFKVSHKKTKPKKGKKKPA